MLPLRWTDDAVRCAGTRRFGWTLRERMWSFCVGSLHALVRSYRIAVWGWNADARRTRKRRSIKSAVPVHYGQLRIRRRP